MIAAGSSFSDFTSAFNDDDDDDDDDDDNDFPSFAFDFLTGAAVVAPLLFMIATISAAERTI